MRRRFPAFWPVFAAFWLATAAAQADGPSLREVQKAYADVDYAGTRALAQAALEQGAHDRQATAELYLLLATAAAALDHAEDARTAFSFALAANPGLRLHKSLSPKIRAPYLEARGSLSATDGKPALDVTLQRRRQELELALHDALHVASSIELGTRADETADFVRRRLNAAPVRRVPTPHGSELQFFVRVLDGYGNVLFDLGTEEEPRRLALLGSPRPQPRTAKPQNEPSPLPYYWTAGALAALGLASGGAATVMFAQREDAAREWNGSSCEHPGSTRGEQCGEVDERRQRAESLSIAFGSAGGALLLGSLVTLVLAPSRARPSTTALVEAAPDHVMLRLRTAL